MIEIEDFIYKTQKAYELERENEVTFAMEDYIEMIYRIEKKEVKITEIAKLLNIKTSSVSKMVIKLKEIGLIEYEKYKLVTLTEKGEKLGEYLLNRHNTLLSLFNLVLPKKDNSYLVEQIEHFFNKDIILNIKSFIENIES